MSGVEVITERDGAVYLRLRLDRRQPDKTCEAACRYAAHALVRYLEREVDRRDATRDVEATAKHVLRTLSDTREP